MFALIDASVQLSFFLVFSGLVDFDFSLIIFVGTLLRSRRYIYLKISPALPPIFKFLEMLLGAFEHQLYY